MNPLSTWIYHQRHPRRSGLMAGLVGLCTLGLYLMVGLGMVTLLPPYPAPNLYLNHLSLVQPRAGGKFDPAILAQVRSHPDVAQVIAENGLTIAFPALVGGNTYPFRLLGLRQADIPGVLALNEVSLSEGRMLRPRSNEVVLAQAIATALGLRVGDTFDRARNRDVYWEVIEPLQVVGILAGEIRLGIVSYEYLESHEIYRDQVTAGYLVQAKVGRASVVDEFLRHNIRGERMAVNTLHFLLSEISDNNRVALLLFGPVALLTTVALATILSVLNRMAFARRLSEFGILYATGHSKRSLTRRVALETATVALTGWLIGLLLAWLVLAILNQWIYAPRGYAFAPLQWPALALATPIPVAIILFTTFTLARTFARLDAVAIVERGELTLEMERKSNPQSSRQASSPPAQPLSSSTFYQRHRRRATLLIGVMTLMIMAVVMLVFVLTTTSDAIVVSFQEFQRVSLVSPLKGVSLPAGVVAQLKTHPLVERVIPTALIKPLSIEVPPFSTNDTTTYAVNEEDLAYLVDLYGLRMKEGRWLRPRTNEIVIAEAVALNRGIKVGDVIGRFEAPAYRDAAILPTGLLVSGIIAKAATPEAQNWLSFASLEFINSHAGFANSITHLLLTAQPGQKVAFDEWLAQAFANDEVLVTTYRQTVETFERRVRNVGTVIILIEGLLVAVAAIALAVLNYIFVSQRQAEFGVLHALGFGRWWLIRRTVREAFFATGAAWGLSVLLCLLSLFYLQFGVFQPRGISLDFFNPLPWLFTAPLPLAVLIASVGSIIGMLFRLDPVAVIERA